MSAGEAKERVAVDIKAGVAHLFTSSARVERCAAYAAHRCQRRRSASDYYSSFVLNEPSKSMLEVPFVRTDTQPISNSSSVFMAFLHKSRLCHA